MKIITGTIEELDALVAQEFVKVVNKKPNAVLGLATGTTPIGVYANLSKMCKEHKVFFTGVKTYNLDEYKGIDPENDQSYRYFMNKYLFSGIDVKIENTHVLSGKIASDAEAEKYDEEIANAGGIDIQILGIGSNGHIAFNEPGTKFDSKTHIVALTESTIKDNSRLFKSIDEVPTHAITMGLATIMKAKKIVLVAYGKNKALAIKKLIEDEPSESLPCSILKKHPDCTIYVDEDAYSLMK